MTAEGIFAGIISTLFTSVAIGAAMMDKYRDDQYIRESRRRYEDEMYSRGFIPIPPGCQNQIFMPPNSMLPCRVNIDMDTSARMQYNDTYRNSMYTGSREVTFRRGDDIIRDIGRRPPQPSPIFGRRYY